MCLTSYATRRHLRSLRLPGLILCSILLAPALAQQVQTPKVSSLPDARLQSIDVPALIVASDHNGRDMHRLLVEFTYTQKRIEREAERNGKIVERKREYEAYPVRKDGSYRHVLSLTRKDGVPLSEEQISENRLLAAAEIEQALKEEETHGNSSPAADEEMYITAGIGITPGVSGEGVWVGVSQFLRHCRFEATGVISLDWRDTVVLAFHSCDGKLDGPREGYIRKLAGQIWIDLKDKVVVRLEAWPTNAGPRSSTSPAQPTDEVIAYQQQRLATGIWAPLRIHLNGLGRGSLFNGVDKEMVFEFTDYRRFSSEIKDAEVTSPKKKPGPM